MMDFIIPHNIGFGSPTYSISFVPVNREDVMLQIVNEFLCPVWVRAYDLGDGEHAWLRGRLSFNFSSCRRSRKLIKEHATWGHVSGRANSGKAVSLLVVPLRDVA
jgi:hypothetical protein